MTGTGQTPGSLRSKRGPQPPAAGTVLPEPPSGGRRAGGAGGEPIENRQLPEKGKAQGAERPSTKKSPGAEPPARRQRRRAPGRGGPGPEAPKGATKGGPGGPTRSARAPPREARATAGSPQRTEGKQSAGAAASGRRSATARGSRPSEGAGGKGSGPATARSDSDEGAISRTGAGDSRGRGARPEGGEPSKAPPQRGGSTRSGQKATADPRPKRGGGQREQGPTYLLAEERSDGSMRAGSGGHRPPPGPGPLPPGGRAAAPALAEGGRPGGPQPPSEQGAKPPGTRPASERSASGERVALCAAAPLLDIRTLFHQMLHGIMAGNEKSTLLGVGLHDVKHYAKIYTYPGGIQDIVASTSPDFGMKGWEKSGESAKRCAPAGEHKRKSSDPKGEDLQRSMRRARAKLRRLALANDFRWFVTLTIDPAKCDSFDGSMVVRKLNAWCSNMVQRKGLRYILVPERHKSGRIHFHGFFNDCLDIVDSGHMDRQGHKVYNLPQWSLGFTTAIELYDDYTKAVGYVC